MLGVSGDVQFLLSTMEAARDASVLERSFRVCLD